MLGADLAGEVSTDRRYTIEPTGERRFTVVAVDLGIKTNTPRMFAERGMPAHVVPSGVTLDEIEALKPDGVFLSNGPGDPATQKTPSRSPRACWAQGFRCSASASATRSSAAHWVSTPTR